MAIPHRRIRARIHYTSDKPDRKGQERGREYFTITVHADGRRTLRAYTEIDDAPNVMRDVTLSLGADWRPTDCFVRLSVGDQMMGTSWFQFTDTEAICEGYTVNEGRISQRYPLKAAAGRLRHAPDRRRCMADQHRRYVQGPLQRLLSERADVFAGPSWCDRPVPDEAPDRREAGLHRP